MPGSGFLRYSHKGAPKVMLRWHIHAGEALPEACCITMSACQVLVQHAS